MGVAILLVLAEMTLQTRSFLKSGQSVFNALDGQTTYVYDEELGLKLLQPSTTVSGTDSTIVTNSLGLRSPELLSDPPEDALRIALLGASSVMGAYTPANDQTAAYRMEDLLERRFPERTVEVINAGIGGYGLDSQRRMFEKILVPLKVDIIVLYTGFNDITGYCSHGTAGSNDNMAGQANAKNYPLHSVDLPSWLLSYQLLNKNTLFLRETAVKQSNQKTLADLNLKPYERDLHRLMTTILDHDIELLALTNARAFRRDMPIDEQMRLSASTRYFNDCFDLPALHNVYDAHNRIIQETAERLDVPLLPLQSIMPGGDDYFADGTHFSVKGEVFVAQTIVEFLIERDIIEE